MLDTPILDEVCAAALRLAATERPPGTPLTTGRVLAALVRTDITNDWQRIWLYTGDPVALGLAEASDGPASSAPQRWGGVPLSDRLAGALWLLNRIGEAYWLFPVPSGALAVALLADPASGASRALLRPGSLTHGELLNLAQSELLNTSLEGLAELIASGPAAPAPVPAVPVSTAPASAAGSARSRSAVPGPNEMNALNASHGAGARARVFGWRVLSCLAVVLTLMAVFWHRQAFPPPTPVVLPPYPVPAVAAQVLATDDLPNVGDGGWLLMQDGPPDSGIFTGTGRLRADLRHATEVGAWQRTWVTVNRNDLVQISAIDLRQRGYAAGYSGLCAPQARVSLPGTSLAGYVTRAPGWAVACARAMRGRTVITFSVQSGDQRADRVAWRVLAASVRRQLPRVPATASDLPAVSMLSSDSRIAINSAFMWVALGIPVLLGLVSLLRDRSSWRRLRSRFFRSRGRGVFSVDPLADVRLAGYGAVTLVRVAVIAWTMRLTEELRFGLWQTLGAAAGAVAGNLAVEWVIRRRRPAPWRPAIFSGGRWLLAAASLVVSAAIVGSGVLLVVDGIMDSSLDVDPAGSDYVTGQLGARLPVFGMLLVLAALLPFTLARRLGMRSLRQQARDPARDGVPPVLMLRSFADDKRLLRARRLDRASIVERLCLRRFERFEEVAAAALAVHGPVYALSRVGEKLPPPLGAERRSFPMDQWQDRVRELITAAQLISVTVGRSQSLLWEIGEIRAAGALGKTIFLLPPTSQREQRRRLVVLAKALQVEFGELDHTDPGRDVLAVAFPAGSGPVVISGRAPDEVGYDSAIAVWALRVTGGPAGYPADVRQAAAALAGYTAGGRTVTRRANRRPAPRYHVYPPGKAPVYQPLWRRLTRWRVLPWVLTASLSGIIWLIFGFLPSSVDIINARYSVGVLTQDEASQAVYGVFGGHGIQRLDFGDPAHYQGVFVKDPVTGLVVDGTVAFYSSGSTGHVGRVDLSTGRTVWVRSVGVGVLSPVLVGGRLAVVSPARGTVVDLAAGDGRVLARRILPGTPFGIAASGDRLFVVLARRNQVAELIPDKLAPVDMIGVPHGPRDIVAQGNRVWVSSLLAHVLTVVEPGAAGARSPGFWLSVQVPEVSANEGWLAIQGMEWVTLVSPAGQVTRVPLAEPDIASLLVQGDGKVIVGYSSGEIDRLG